MALKDKIANADVKETPSATTTTATTSNSSTSKTDAFKQKGAAERAQMTEDQKAIEGSKSDKVEFICALGDPNRKQSRVENKTSIPSYVVVGYKFKTLEAMKVPFAPISSDWKTPLDVEPAQWREVPANTEVALNIVEAAMFIVQLEFAGKFTGGGKGVYISAKNAGDRQEPLPVLNKIGSGSIKENMELIADMVGATADSKGTPQIKDEFKESFGALYTKKSLAKKSASTKKKVGEGQADIAAAFRLYYANK